MKLFRGGRTCIELCNIIEFQQFRQSKCMIYSPHRNVGLSHFFSYFCLSHIFVWQNHFFTVQCINAQHKHRTFHVDVVSAVKFVANYVLSWPKNLVSQMLLLLHVLIISKTIFRFADLIPIFFK